MKTATTATKGNKTNNASNVTDIKAAKKITLARTIYSEVTDSKFVAPEDSSPRAEFLKRCKTELGMSDSGASTYWQNLNKEHEKGTLYPYAKAPTGAPRGRRPAADRDVKKAAAKATRLVARIAKDNAELQKVLGGLTPQ